MIHIPGKLIFVKPKKVGGSTMEFLLSSVCGPSDAVTPLTVGEDCERCRLGYQLPVNVFDSSEGEQRYHEAVRDLCELKASSEARGNHSIRNSPTWKLAVKLRKKVLIDEHAGLGRIRRFVGDTAFRSTALVSICRHPYELAVSQAFWNLRKGEASDLDEAIDAVVSSPHFNIRRYGLHRRWRKSGSSISYRTPFTFILRLEELAKDLALLSELVQRNLPVQLPHLKGGSRLDRRPAEVILSNTQKRMMERYNKPLFDLWDNPPRP